MNKDQAKGAVKEVAGKVQVQFGKVTGNTTQRMKGLAREASGKTQKVFGDVKQILTDARRKP